MTSNTETQKQPVAREEGPHCPKCGAEIDHLEAYSLEENRQEVTLIDCPSSRRDLLEWSESEPIEETCVKIDFECPECKEVIYSNDGDSTDQAIIDFLSGKGPLPTPEAPETARAR